MSKLYPKFIVGDGKASLINDAPVLSKTDDSIVLIELAQYVKKCRIDQGYKTVNDLAKKYPYRNSYKFLEFIIELETTGICTNDSYLEALKRILKLSKIDQLINRYEELVKQQNEADEKARERDLKQLKKALKLFIKNRDIIINNPKYYYITHSSIFISSAYVGRKAKYTIGEMLDHWQKGEMTDDQSCCGKVYITSAGGSPLSGRNSFYGFCTKCGKWVEGSKSSFGLIFGPYIKYKQPEFDFTDGDIATFDELILALGGELPISE